MLSISVCRCLANSSGVSAAKQLIPSLNNEPFTIVKKLDFEIVSKNDTLSFADYIKYKM